MKKASRRHAKVFVSHNNDRLNYTPHHVPVSIRARESMVEGGVTKLVVQEFRDALCHTWTTSLGATRDV